MGWGQTRNPNRRLVIATIAAIVGAWGLPATPASAAVSTPVPVATFTVTNANDSGPGSLRQAIFDANGHSGFDLIAFAIGSGPQTISPLSGLPAITDPTIVDGATQPGFAGSPIIELNGASTGPFTTGIIVTAGGSTIRGLVINRFPGNGVFLGEGGGNVVEVNFIGTDLSGHIAQRNGANGLVVLGPSTNNLIGGTGEQSRNVIAASGDKGIVIAQGGSANIIGNFLGTDAFGAIALPNHFWGVGIESSNGSHVIANIISGNGVSGVKIEGGSSGNVLERNLIGTNGAGTAGLANGTWGILIDGAQNNMIGPGNVISGNGLDGIVINGPQSTGNVVAGNLVGTDVTGTRALGNGRIGVYLPFATHNTIGGTTATARNVISGNPADGVNIGGDANIVQGNYIGTDITGTHAIGNDTGVFLYQGADNVVGGATAAARNLISGNLLGVNIGGGRATGNRVQGNYIGTDVLGAQPLGNGYGITVYMGLNTIGGDQPGAGNVISGNQFEGIQIVACGGNVVQGNYIGTDGTGTAALQNGDAGVSLVDAFNNLIGGHTAGARNVISGNAYPGVQMYGSGGATGNRVEGNYIGTDRTGSAPIPNGFTGVLLEDASNNTVGPGNVISGNMYPGVELSRPATTANHVMGNFIGTDAAGAHALANGGFGISVDGASANLIGGSSAAERNVIAGNGMSGIGLNGAGPGNTVEGNYIGTDVSGTAPIPNQAFGIGIADSPSTAVTGNVIAANAYDGIYIVGTASNHTTVQGNMIGTDRTGARAMGNGSSGITVESSTDTLIGGTSSGTRNIISGNGADGVFIFGDQSTRNLVQGNYVGTDSTGTSAIANGFVGVQVDNGTGNYVGGTAAGAGNLVSGNANNGVQIDFSPGPNYVLGNLIGTDRTGTAALGNGSGPGNGTFGIWVGDAAGTVIGGATPAARNVISGNHADGVALFGTNTIYTQVQGNFIGVDASGSSALGNHGNGIIIDANASDNNISGNVIANNDFNGVVVWFGVRDSIRANSIYSNVGMGIDLNNDGVTLNDRGDVDGGADNSQNFPVLSRVVGTPANLVVEGTIDTPNPQTVTIEIYANASPDPGTDYSGYGEGQTLIATVKPNSSGRFAVVLPPVPKGTVISATATDAQGNTSEFALDKIT
jgi:titin